MVFAPGRDRNPGPGGSVAYSPRNGAGGTFAEFMQGCTPKYAVNEGYRRDLFRNTLSRMYLRVEAAEMNLFLASIADSHTRSQLAPRIAGDPTPRQRNRRSGGGGTQDNTARQRQSVSTNGYLDFFIQQAALGFQEKFSVSETLGDNFVAYFFGQSTPIWPFTGWLLNTVQDDQATNFMRLYLELLRGTALARRQKTVTLKIDSYLITGSMTNLNMQFQSQAEIYVPFSFQLLVRKVQIVNYTLGWVPTRADTPFAADPNAIPYDGRPRSTGAATAVTMQIPPNTQAVTPGARADVDTRVHQTPAMTPGEAPTQPTPAEVEALNPRPETQDYLSIAAREAALSALSFVSPVARVGQIVRGAGALIDAIPPGVLPGTSLIPEVP